MPIILLSPYPLFLFILLKCWKSQFQLINKEDTHTLTKSKERWRSSVMRVRKRRPCCSALQMKQLSAVTVIAQSTTPTSSQANTNASFCTSPLPKTPLSLYPFLLYSLYSYFSIKKDSRRYHIIAHDSKIWSLFLN